MSKNKIPRWFGKNVASDVVVEPDPANGLDTVSAVQCQHLRSVSTQRIRSARGNVGASVLAQVRETLAVILDLG